MFPDRLRYVDTVDKVSKLVESTNVKIANLYSLIQDHDNNTIKHITENERDSWNAKVDLSVFNEFKDALNSRLGSSSSAGNDSDPSTWSDGDIITYVRLKTYLLKYYYTTTQIDTKLNNLLTKIPSLAGYATQTYVDNAIAAIKLPDSGISSTDLNNTLANYYTKTQVDSFIKSTLDLIPSLSGYATEAWVTSLIGKASSGISSYTDADVKSLLDKNLSLNKNAGYFYLTWAGTQLGNRFLDEVGDTSGKSDIDGLEGDIIVYFTITKDGTTPELPSAFPNATFDDILCTNSTNTYWVHNMPTYNGQQHLWMSQTIKLTDSKFGAWSTPIDITGGDAGAGSDTATTEYIYRLSDYEDPTILASSLTNNSTQDKYVPVGWTNHPSGIADSTGRHFEFIAFRTKSDGKWDNFQGPYLWSSYGRNGSDGDGVQYIFYTGTSAPTSSDSTNWPPSWSSRADYQNGLGNEYIAGKWTDDPTNITNGQSQWVSMRKYNGDTKLWSTYSNPALWSYIPNDVISEGVIVCSPNMAIITVKDGASLDTTIKFIVTWYKDSGTQSITNLSNLIIKDENDNIFTNFTHTENQLLDGSYIITLHFNAKAFVEAGKNYNLTMDVTSTIGKRNIGFVISTTGATTGPKGNQGDPGKDGIDGKDGPQYGIILNTHSVRISEGTTNPSYIPGTITASTHCENVSDTSGILLQYSIDNSTWYNMPANGLASSSFANSGIVYFKMTNKGTTVASDTVVFIHDGRNGVSATEYVLSVNSANVQYNANTGKTTGTYTITAKYKPANSTTYLPWNRLVYSDHWRTTGIHDLSYTFTLDSEGKGSEEIDAGVDLAYITVQMCDGTAEAEDVGNVIRSVVIPVVQIAKNGKDGSSTEVQTINTYLRKRTERTDTDEDYLDGRSSAASDGTYPQDFVVWSDANAADTSNWGTYLCIQLNRDNWASIPNTPAHWSKASYNAVEAFDTMFAKKADISSLTSNQVVITDPSSGNVVAGMTSTNIYNTSDGKTASITLDSNGIGSIRIWAGQPELTGNFTTTPFNVTDAGTMTAKGAIIDGFISNSNRTSGMSTNGVIANSYEDSQRTYQNAYDSKQNGDSDIVFWAGTNLNSGENFPDLSNSNFVVRNDGTVITKKLTAENCDIINGNVQSDWYLIDSNNCNIVANRYICKDAYAGLLTLNGFTHKSFIGREFYVLFQAGGFEFSIQIKNDDGTFELCEFITSDGRSSTLVISDGQMYKFIGASATIKSTRKNVPIAIVVSLTDLSKGLA